MTVIQPQLLSKLLDDDEAALRGLAGFGIDPLIQGIALDSRQIRPGWLFIALAGYADQTQHGLKYLDKAVRQGALAVLWEPPGDAARAHDSRLPMIPVKGLHDKILDMARRLYPWPASGVDVIGITGTDGKTSSSHYLAQTLSEDGQPCGVIGTVGWGVYGALESATHTTPDVLSVHRLIAEQVEAGARAVSMEVSSHALDQGRVAGVEFTVAMLTNLQRDHLDYHHNLENYAAAKAKLFTSAGLKIAVLNADDAFSRTLRESLQPGVECVWYGLDARTSIPSCDRFVLASNMRSDVFGQGAEIHSSWGEGLMMTALLGRFNIANLLGVLGILLSLGMSLDEALGRLRKVENAPGRMQRLGGRFEGDRVPLVVVDYAHTPAALEQALSALRDHLGLNGRLHCVFGCGGDRDRGKRPLMAQAVERLADRVVLTNDNPRHEAPARIFSDILAGMEKPETCRLIEDRAEAIAQAVAAAAVDDIVLIAGKGHEDYQLFADKRVHFDDREQAMLALAAWRQVNHEGGDCSA